MRVQRLPGRELARRAATAVFIGFFLLTVALQFASLPLGAYAALFTSIPPGIPPGALVRVGFWVGPIPVPFPLVLPLGVLFLSLLSIYLAFLLISAARRTALPRTLADGFRGGLAPMLGSDLVVAVLSTGFLALTATSIDYAASLVGVPVGTLNAPDMDIFVSATASPLTEELGFRVLVIGLVALALSAGKPLRSKLAALWRPWSVIGEGSTSSGSRSVLWAALAGSALIFGVAHVVSNSGWAIGKLPEAAFGGLVLGYVYVRYGFHVAVLTHWGLDYLGTVYSFYGEGVYGIPWNSSPGYGLQQLVSADLLYGIGLVSVAAVAYLAVGRMMGQRRNAPNP